MTKEIQSDEKMSETMDLGNDETPLMGNENKRNTFRNQPTTRTYFVSALRACLAEALGVCIFVFIGTVSGSHGDLVSVAMAHGLTIMILIIAFGDLSGGHFNPCVSLGAFLGGAIGPIRFIFYVLFQLWGSIVGAAITRGVLSLEEYKSIDGGIPHLGPDVTIGQGILCEAALTLLLVTMVLMTAVDRNDNTLAPVAIGMAVAVDIVAAGPISGAVMNPARAFGPTIIGMSVFNMKIWHLHFIYWAGPVSGTLVAVILYRFIFGSTEKRVICKD